MTSAQFQDPETTVMGAVGIAGEAAETAAQGTTPDLTAQGLSRYRNARQAATGIPRSGASPSAPCRSRPRLVCHRGLEGCSLVCRRRLVPDEGAEHLAGVLEGDPDEQLHELRSRELLEQEPHLGVADRGVIGRDGVGERNRERALRVRLLRRRPAQGRAELAAGPQRERTAHLLLELWRQRR